MISFRGRPTGPNNKRKEEKKWAQKRKDKQIPEAVICSQRKPETEIVSWMRIFREEGILSYISTEGQKAEHEKEPERETRMSELDSLK